jgi:hypothetical protein
MKFVWRELIEFPGGSCFQLIGFRLPEVFSLVVQRLRLGDSTQLQFLFAVEL